MNPTNETVISYDRDKRMFKVAGPYYAPVWTESEELARIVAGALSGAKVVLRATA